VAEVESSMQLTGFIKTDRGVVMAFSNATQAQVAAAVAQYLTRNGFRLGGGNEIDGTWLRGSALARGLFGPVSSRRKYAVSVSASNPVEATLSSKIRLPDDTRNAFVQQLRDDFEKNYGGAGSVAVQVAGVDVPFQGTQSSARRECPHCKEAMRRDAYVCPHCRNESKAWIGHDDLWWTTTTSGKWQWFDEGSQTWQQLSEPALDDPDSSAAATAESPSEEEQALERPCPHCKESMARLGHACPHCARESQPWTLSDGTWWVRVGSRWHWLDASTGVWRTSPPSQDAPTNVPSA
jgi:RNA polymerase subunit RPABC4/transcription elongation factor Spt4